MTKSIEVTINGPSNKVLEIDLTARSWSVYTISRQDRKQYLGGKGLGLKLVYDRMAAGIDPLGPDNIIAVMPGILMGTNAPCTGRFAAVTKSPLTGIFASSSCGGPFGMALKTAGWDGLLIKGAANEPIGLELDHETVRFCDADPFWGLDTFEVQDRLANPKSGCLVIGPAGENLVRFANIASGHRFLGRAGFGAVMGAKKLKYIKAIGGKYKIRPMNEQLFDACNKKARKYIRNNAMTGDVLKKYGTASNTIFTTRHGILPVNNFKDGSHPDQLNLTGQAMAEKYHTKPHTCKPCTIRCGHKGIFPEGETLPVPEYETVGLLGANLGIFDTAMIARFNRICSGMGMDTISAGGTLGWAMEATEKGLVQSSLSFGNADTVEQALLDIAHVQGLGRELALGSKALSEKYGGADFAIQVKGLEMAAYDPREAVGQGLAYATANRGACHLSAYPVALEGLFDLINPFTTLSKASFTVFLENLYSCVNSLHTCQFTAFAYLFEPALTKYTPNTLLGMFMQYLTPLAIQLIDFSLYRKLWEACSGLKIGSADFIKAGQRIHVLERWMNTREGISRKDDTLPKRLLNEGRLSDRKNHTVPLEKMLKKYYRLRKFTPNGIPTPKLLTKLNIQ